MITTRLSSRSFQSIMNDETLGDDLTTLNQNSSSSILYRTLNIQYISQKYLIQKNSSQLIQTESTKSNDNKSELFQTSINLTPRNISIIELITSEQRFVHDMQNILKTYIIPMLDSKILSSSHIDGLFLNWPSLTRTHEKLANELMIALKTDREQISIGKILCDFIPELIDEYEVYFRFHPTAMKYFREQLQISSKFRTFMQKTKQQTYGIGTMGDANILTLPLQRIAKYPFMIYQIIKHTTDNSSDYISLHNSLNKANELRETINNVIDEEINRVKFEWLQTHVDCTKISETIIFNSLTHFNEQRKLIYYNYIKTKTHVLYAMLFNDFLLLTRVKRVLITKIFQIFSRKIFNHSKSSITQLNMNDWFDTPERDHIYLIVYKKPIMLHDIRNIQINKNDSTNFQFDYRGYQMNFSTNSINERVLWMKYLNETIDICRRQLLITSMFRIPESNSNSMIYQSIGKIFIREINIINLPFISNQKYGNNPYCIMEINNCQRQTTPVICDISNNFQWNILFQFFLSNIKQDTIKCFVYNRSKYTIDRLLGSVEIPLNLLIEQDDSLEINHNSKQRTFALQHSSTNSQISLKYHVLLK